MPWSAARAGEKRGLHRARHGGQDGVDAGLEARRRPAGAAAACGSARAASVPRRRSRPGSSDLLSSEFHEAVARPGQLGGEAVDERRRRRPAPSGQHAPRVGLDLDSGGSRGAGPPASARERGAQLVLRRVLAPRGPGRGSARATRPARAARPPAPRGGRRCRAPARRRTRASGAGSAARRTPPGARAPRRSRARGRAARSRPAPSRRSHRRRRAARARSSGVLELHGEVAGVEAQRRSSRAPARRGTPPPARPSRSCSRAPARARAGSSCPCRRAARRGRRRPARARAGRPRRRRPTTPCASRAGASRSSPRRRRRAAARRAGAARPSV